MFLRLLPCRFAGGFTIANIDPAAMIIGQVPANDEIGLAGGELQGNKDHFHDVLLIVPACSAARWRKST